MGYYHAGWPVDNGANSLKGVYKYVLNYDDKEGDTDEEEDSAAVAKATDSHMAHKVWAILQGSVHIPAYGGAGSSSSEGVDIHPGNNTEFRFACDALDQVHHENNVNTSC